MKMLLIILAAIIALFIGLILDDHARVIWYGVLTVALSVLGARFFNQYQWLFPLAIVGIVVAVRFLLGEREATIAELILLLAMLIIILVQGEKKNPDIFLDLNKDVGIFAENGPAEPMPNSGSETNSASEAEPEPTPAQIFSSALVNPGVGEEIITVASQYEGYPYVWGGSSLENGCDCSHFVWLILKKIGFIPPEAKYYTTPNMKENEDTLISEWGLKKVESLENATNGDIILYANADGVVHHVAFYNATTGCIIEAQGPLAGITTNRPVERDGQQIVAIYRVSGERYM